MKIKYILFALLLILLSWQFISASPKEPVSAVGISLGTAQISGYHEGTYDYVYMGAYENKPMKWKVLSSLSNTGENTGLFLLADYGVSNSRFGDSNDWKNTAFKLNR